MRCPACTSITPPATIFFLFLMFISICLSVPYDPEGSAYSPTVLAGSAAVIAALLAFGYLVLKHCVGYTLLCAVMGFALVYCRRLNPQLQRVYQWTFIASLYSFSRMRGDVLPTFFEKLLLIAPSALVTYGVCFRLLGKPRLPGTATGVPALVRTSGVH